MRPRALEQIRLLKKGLMSFIIRVVQQELNDSSASIRKSIIGAVRVGASDVLQQINFASKSCKFSRPDELQTVENSRKIVS
jgi:hypothetical protein